MPARLGSRRAGREQGESCKPGHWHHTLRQGILFSIPPMDVLDSSLTLQEDLVHHGRTWRLVAATPLACLAGLLTLTLLAAPALAKSFTVTSAGDTPYPPTGATPCTSNAASCTLRAAIVEGNNSTGPHTITFAVPKVTISNGGGLTLTAPFIISGIPALRTIIDGGGLPCFTLSDAQTAQNPKGANGTTISFLNIQHCGGDAISGNGHGFKILSNYIGTDVTGLSASAKTANTGHGISVSSSHIYVAIDSASKVNTFLKGVYDSFPFPLPDISLPDVSGQINKFSGNLVTALAALTDPILITDNVIGGNGGHGVEVFSENLAAVIISKNMIGVDAAGAFALPNGKSGVHFIGGTFGNLVGPGNVISGNTQHGVHVESGAVLLPIFIMGNAIGLGALDTAKVGNGLSGVYVGDATPSTAAASYNATSLSLVIAGNVISGNQGENNNAYPDTLGADQAGVVITGKSTKVKVVGNTIGLGDFGKGPVASAQHGNKGDGVIVTSSDNSIGGSGAGDANTIAANGRHGIVVKLATTSGTSILGNYLGVAAGQAGNLTLGNGSDGIHLDAASATTVGGTGATDRNVIAANKRHGIALRNGGNDSGWANLFQRNLIYHNASLGIDLDHPKNAADDPAHTPYPQNYPNLDQNQPVICAAGASDGACAGASAPSTSGASTRLDWTLVAKPSATHRLEFFKLDAASQTAAKAMTFLGEQTATADSSGKLTGCTNGRCSSTLPVNTGGGYLVMTATDVTKIVFGPSSPGWFNILKCFALKNCTTDSTSELSNVAQVSGSAAVPPTAASVAASDLTQTTATLHGTVSANGVGTTVTFSFGATASYGSTATAKESPLAGSASAAAVSAALTGLTCNTTYHFRVEASSTAGDAKGDDLSFTTAVCGTTNPPVETPPANSGGCALAGAATSRPGTGLALLALLGVLGLCLALRRRR